MIFDIYFHGVIIKKKTMQVYFMNSNFIFLLHIIIINISLTKKFNTAPPHLNRKAH